MAGAGASGAVALGGESKPGIEKPAPVGEASPMTRVFQRFGLTPLSALALLSACPAAGPVPVQPEQGTLFVAAGDTASGYVDGVGESARFNGIAGLAALSDDEIVVSDAFNALMRRVVVPSQEVTTLIGEPMELSATDGQGASARVREPRGVTVDGDTAWIGDGPCVRRLLVESLTLQSVAGSCQTPGKVDGTLADARFGFLIQDLEWDSARRRLYVSDRANNAVRVVDPELGTVSTLAEGFDGPGALALNGDTLYVANTFDHTIHAVDLLRGRNDVVAGISGVEGSVDASNLSARLSAPQGIAIVGEQLWFGGFDGDIRAYDLTDGFVSTIVRGTDGMFAPPVSFGTGFFFAGLDGGLEKVTADGTVTLVAGPADAEDFVDGSGTNARFRLPVSVELDRARGVFYVSDAENDAIRIVNPSDWSVRTLVGGPDRRGDEDGSVGEAGLYYPAGLALDAAARFLYVADNGNLKIRVIDLENFVVSTLSGSGASGGDDGEALAATFGAPWELALSEDEATLYVADFNGGSIRAVATGNGTVSTLVRDLGEPTGLALAGGFLWATDYARHVLWRIDRQAGTAEVALGEDGFMGSVDGAKAAALLAMPSGLGVAADGDALLLAETASQTVRRIELDDFHSTFVAGLTTRSGGLPPGTELPLDEAPLLNPQDALAFGDQIVILSGASVLVAAP